MRQSSGGGPRGGGEEEAPQPSWLPPNLCRHSCRWSPPTHCPTAALTPAGGHQVGARQHNAEEEAVLLRLVVHHGLLARQLHPQALPRILGAVLARQVRLRAGVGAGTTGA